MSVMFAEVEAASDFPRDDPEDLRELVGDALANVITAVEGLGGTVTSVSGAGLEALFGAPEAHEDDPERAVRAAFRAVSRRQPGNAALRAGVETGPAIVGPVRTGASSYYRVVGEVVGAAAALQSVARSFSVLVGPATRAATEGIFEWGATEEVVAAKGAKPSVGAYLERPKPRAPARQLRFGGRGSLVGRSEEVSSLTRVLRATEEGTGSVVVIEGEPGLGKTRLVEECRKRFMAWVGARSGRLPLWVEGRCASYASTTPYGLYRHLLANWAGVAPDQPEAVVAPALERATLAVMGDKELWPVLARMMDLSAGAQLANMRPLELQRETFAAVRRIIARLARAGPTVLALEDLHWADVTSLRLTQELASLVLQVPLLVLATRRPHPDPGVSAMEQALDAALGVKLQHIRLGPLAPAAEEELATLLVGEGAGPGVVDAVRAGTAGNPLFLEERLFSMVHVGALVGGPGRWQLSERASVEVPEVLERLVRSRADHLSAGAQAVIQAASVIGTEPGLALLAATCDAGDQLAAHLTEVAGAGLLCELANAPDPTYRFRHALVQEAIYRGMLRAERRQLHTRVAWALESLSEGRLSEVAGVLGRHFAAAGEQERERAVHYFEMAGDHALRSFANDEAITLFQSALDVVKRESSGTEAMANIALGLRGKLAQVLRRTGKRREAREVLQDAINSAGPGNRLQSVRLALLLGQMAMDETRFADARSAYDSAENLLGDRPQEKDEATVNLWLEIMLNGRAQLYVQTKQAELAEGVLSAARPLLEAQGPKYLWHVYYRYLSVQQALVRGWEIDEEVLSTARMSVATASAGDDESDIYKEKGPATAWAALYLGWYLLMKGELTEAEENLRGSLAVAERSGDIILRACDLYCLVVAALRRHDIEDVRRIAPQSQEAGASVGFPEVVGNAKGCLAWLAWQDGDPKSVLKFASEAEDLLRIAKGPLTMWKWTYLWPLVALHLRDERVGEALEAGSQMLDPYQQRLPDTLKAMLKSARTAWADKQVEASSDFLFRALELAHQLHFF